MHSCDRHDLRSIGWWVGKSSVTRRAASHAVEGEVWILAHLPDPVTTFLLAEVAHLQQNNLVSTEWHCGQWEIFFDLSSGPLITVICMDIHGNTWTHALHATHFNCLTSSLYHLEVGWSFYPFVLFLWPIACVYA